MKINMGNISSIELRSHLPQDASSAYVFISQWAIASASIASHGVLPRPPLSKASTLVNDVTARRKARLFGGTLALSCS